MTINRENPCPLVLDINKRLNKEGSKKDTRHLELNLGDSPLEYKVGDSVGVWPENDPELIKAILMQNDCKGDEEVNWESESKSLSEVLSRQVSLHKITRQLLPNLIEICPLPKEKALLSSLQAPDNKENFKKEFMDPLDVMQAVTSAKLNPQLLVDSLGKMTPRLYSIASSLKADKNSVHMTVAVVNTLHKNRLREGVCSTYMCERVPLSHSMLSFVQPSKHFAMPIDGEVPIIMVGPGTGIAPFRAFLKERQALGSTGKNWLFFGDQHRDTDFLYGDEFSNMLKDGFLNKLDLAFSRDQDYKIYVQNKMMEKAKDLWDWLENGAYFYVCGDAKYMAKDVEKALFDIIKIQGGKSEAGAKEYVKLLKKASRYQKDVY